jgi:ABC-2 type transport system permease protein
MNSPSNAMPESLDSQRVVPAVFSETRPLYWSVRRELWENRWVYLGPLVAGGIFLFGYLISLFGLPHRMSEISALNPAQQHSAILAPYDMVAGLLMLTQMLVGVFYCLDAFQGERRDRSILFWKSLPVSDLTTVLAKASIPFVILPLATVAVTVFAQLVILLLSTFVLLASGHSVASSWR